MAMCHLCGTTHTDPDACPGREVRPAPKPRELDAGDPVCAHDWRPQAFNGPAMRCAKCMREEY